MAPSSLSHLIEAEIELESASHWLQRLLRLTVQRLHLPDEPLLKRHFGLGTVKNRSKAFSSSF